VVLDIQRRCEKTGDI